MRIPTFTIAAATIFAALAGPAAAEDETIRVADNYFVSEKSSVPTVLISRGDTVMWTFEGRDPHNVTVRSGPERFRSQSITTGDFEKTLRRRGIYRIYCTIHGASDMSMTLRVTG